MIPHFFLKIGSSGATVRMYVDTYEADKSNQLKSAGEIFFFQIFFFVKSKWNWFHEKMIYFCEILGEMLAPCIDVALQISQLPKFTGRNEPTVITWK